MKQIAIFASGTGTNAEKVIEHFKNSDFAQVSLVVCNKPGAQVLNIAKTNHIETLVFNRQDFYESGTVLGALKKRNIDFIILAGFLWLVPMNILDAYRDRIINIHPALLPKFGGKGMYGNKVHQAVLDAGEKETGITIHYVTKNYDEGEIIFQAKCPVTANDSIDSIRQKVQQLEHEHYPKVVEQVLNLQLA